MEYMLLIKTDLYTGNFEREMCAYATGQVGSDDESDERIVLADRMRKEDPALFTYLDADMVMEVRHGDDGWFSPVQCAGNDMEIYFENKPTLEALCNIGQRLRQHAIEGVGYEKSHHPEILDIALMQREMPEWERVAWK